MIRTLVRAMDSVITYDTILCPCVKCSTRFPLGCADAAAVDGRRGSNVYEVNPWLWQFGRGKPRLGDLSVEETEERKQAHRDESHKRAVETRRRRKADRT